MELYYDFRIDGRNAGYYYLKIDASHLRSHTRFRVDDTIQVSLFEVRHDGERALAYRCADAPWIDLADYPADHVPTSAYPILLPRAIDRPLVYTAILEGDGLFLPETVLAPSGDEIVESRGGRVVRRFTMRDGVPVQIDWGGPVSHLRDNVDEAVRKSGVKFVA